MRFSILCPALLTLAGLLAAPAFAQAPPPPGFPLPSGKAAAPPPPPRGPSVILDSGPGGAVHADVRCTETDTTRACVDLATQLLDKLNGAVQAK